MATDRRSAEDIRRELATEREQLADALAGLREDVNSARRIPMIVGGALLAGLAAFAAVKLARGRGE
ncbi:MAG TPA: hypothetical protein VD769_00390 [Gaiellaceae bacterium]|nr:hypothetical protein [Gaiellaceae bacterium]